MVRRLADSAGTFVEVVRAADGGGGGGAAPETGIVPSPLRGLPAVEQTLPALLERQAARYGDKPLLRIGDLERSFQEVRDAAAASAGALRAAGVQRGDRLALLCENRVEMLDYVLGCAWIGAVSVPLNTALRGEQLRHQLENSAARVLAIDSAMVDVLGYLEPPSALEAVWALDGVPESTPKGYNVVTAPTAEALPAESVGPGETAAILYTSGTTGVSKGVCCPQAQFYWWGVLVGEMLELGEDDVLYTCLPLFHTNALNAFVQALVAGATYHLGPRFSASRFWTRAAEADATVTYLLGAMVSILLTRPEGEADRAHGVRRALAPGTAPADFERFGERFGVGIVEGYGSTETNCAIGASWRHQRPGFMGPVRAGFHAQVVDENDMPLPDGTGGELVLRHDPAFSFATGYFAMPEKTVEAWSNLWFHTGDRVVRDGEGWYRFTDRLKDSIRRRGENISSFEVEQAVEGHAAVEAVAAFPVASEVGEDEVAVAVVLREGVELDPVDLMRYCQPRLAYFAIPRFVRIVDELPLTLNGKVRKAELRSAGVTADTWDREAAGVTLDRGVVAAPPPA